MTNMIIFAFTLETSSIHLNWLYSSCHWVHSLQVANYTSTITTELVTIIEEYKVRVQFAMSTV